MKLRLIHYRITAQYINTIYLYNANYKGYGAVTLTKLP